MGVLGCIQKDKKSYTEIHNAIKLNNKGNADCLKELVRMKLATRRIGRGYPIRVYYQATEEGVKVFNAMHEIHRLTKDYEMI
jgi:DNA-binding HxlR family transcriptional regulator